MTVKTLSDFDQARLKRWQMGMLLLAIFCEIFLAADWYGVAAALPFLSADLGLDPSQAGMAQGIFALTYGIGMVVWSPLSRKMPATTMQLIGLAGAGIGMIFQTFVQTYAQLILLRLIIGFFDAAVFIGVMKLLFDWFPQHRRGFVVGLILAAYSLAITMDFALGIPLILSFGWRVFFAALAGGTLVVAAVVMIVGRATPATIGYRDLDWGDDPEPAALATREIFRSKWVLVAGIGIAACTFAIAGTATWVVPAFIAEQGMPVESAGLIGTMMGLSQVVFLVLGGILADKVAKSLMIRATAFLALLVALMFLTSTLYPLSFGVLVVYAGLSGVAVLGGGAVFALMSEKYPVALAPAAIGFAEVFGILSSFAAPALMGAIISRTGTFFSAFLAFAIAEAVLVAILMVIAREPSGQKSARSSYGPSL